MYHEGDIKLKSAAGETLISPNVSVALTEIILQIKW